ncbi:MAG: DUF3231 family protein [Halanaerobiales bacterium]
MEVGLNIFKKAKTDTENLSAQEAYNIWETLRARYNSGETIQFFSNFIHDRDFDFLLNNHFQNVKNQIGKLEKMASEYNIKTPTPFQKLIITADLDQITDKFIFRKIVMSFRSELLSLSKNIITSTFNDEVRNNFINFTISHLNDYQRFYKYGKVKGWFDIPPAYKTYKSEEKEQLSQNEATQIWNHLNLRYDQTQMNRIFSQFIHDMEFEKILDRGNKILAKQINFLEEKSAEYEIPIPEKHPSANQITIDPEVIEDRFLYRRILDGIQGSVDLHIRAVLETTRNDSLREIFFDFLQEELGLYNSFLKYGKAKGWVHIVPRYKLI